MTDKQPSISDDLIERVRALEERVAVLEEALRQAASQARHMLEGHDALFI